MVGFVVSGGLAVGKRDVSKCGHARPRGWAMVMEKRERVRVPEGKIAGEVNGRILNDQRQEKGGTKVANPPGAIESVELLYENAKAVQQRGDWRTAVRMFEQVLKMDPTNGKNWADLENKVGRHSIARKLYGNALRANRRLHSIYNSWGSMEYRLGNVRAARRLFLRGLEKNPDNVRLLYSLGVLEDKQRNAEVARRLLMRGLKNEPDNAYLHQALALVELKAHRVSNARECLRRATSVDPKNTLAWLTWAQLEELQSNFDVARRYYRIGSQVKARESVTIWQSWAKMEEKIGREEEAIEIYEEAISERMADAMLYNQYGKLVRKRGDCKRAIQLFRTGLGLDDKHPQLYKNIALTLLEQGHEAQARRVFDLGSCRGKGRDLCSLLHAWAVFEWKEGEIDVARDLFERASKADPNCGWLWMWYGMFEEELGRVDLARHYYGVSINADPNDGSPWRAWAELERREGKEANARFYFKRASELDNRTELYNLDPDSPLAKCHLH